MGGQSVRKGESVFNNLGSRWILTDAGVQSTTSKLLLDEGIESCILLSTSQLLLYVLRLLDSSVLVQSTGTGSTSLGSDGLTVVLLVCHSERGSIDFNNSTLDECVCSDQFVVGSVENDSQNTSLGSDVL